MFLHAGPLPSGPDPRDRRRHRRLAEALPVIIGATPFETLDWSPGGLLVADYAGPHRPASGVVLRLLLGRPDGGPVLCHLAGIVCRLDAGAKRLAIRFPVADALVSAAHDSYCRLRLLAEPASSRVTPWLARGVGAADGSVAR